MESIESTVPLFSAVPQKRWIVVVQSSPLLCAGQCQLNVQLSLFGNSPFMLVHILAEITVVSEHLAQNRLNKILG